MAKELDFLVRQLTNFYQDNLPENSALEKMLNVYIHSASIYWNELEQLKKSMVLETSPTLTTLPYAKLDVSQGIYGETLAQILSRMDNLEEQIKRLNDEKLFVEFDFSDLNQLERLPAIYSMTLRTRFRGTEDLVLYEDYFLRNNRLYFLPNFILKKDVRAKEMHAFNIQLNEYVLEDKFGSYFGIETGPLVSRHQYRDVISAFRQLLKSDLTIRDMRDAITLATDWDNFNIQDRFTPDLAPSLLRLYESWLLSPQRFIVTLPEELIADKMKLNILLSMLNEAKEEQVNYFILFGIKRVDPTHNTDEAKMTTSWSEREAIDADDRMTFSQNYRIEENLFARHRYDEGRHYDYKLQYEGESMELPTKDGEDHIYVDDGETAFDTPWAHQTEYVNVRHVEFPEIPRDFSMSSSGADIAFSLRGGEEGVTRFELYESESLEGPYYFVAESLNDGEEIVINYNANKSGNLYYKIRAAAESEKSLFTLPVSVSI